MAGNFAEFGAEESGARIAELDHQKDISSSIQNLMHFAQAQEADAKIPFVRAEARKTGAEADVLENKVRVQRQLADLMANRQPGDIAGGGSGNIAYEAAGLYAKAGDMDEATKLWLRGTQGEANQALVGYRALQAQNQQIEALRHHATLVGSLTLGVHDQDSYNAFLEQARTANLNVGQLPPDYAQAKPLLAQLTAQGMTVAEWSTRQIAENNARERTKLDAARIRASEAQVAASSARTALIRQRLSDIIRNDGERSPQAAAYRKELTELARTRREALELKNPPPLPPTAAAATEGRVYKMPDGTVVRATKKPDGTMGIMPVATPKASLVDRIGSAAAGAFSSLSSSSNDDAILGDNDDE